MTALLAMIRSSTVPPTGRDGEVLTDGRVLDFEIDLDLVPERVGRQGSGFALDLPDDLAEVRHVRPSFLSAGLVTLKRQT